MNDLIFLKIKEMLIYLGFFQFLVKLELDVGVSKTSLLLWHLRQCMLSTLRNYMALKEISVKIHFTFLCVGGNFFKSKCCSKFWDVLHKVVTTSVLKNTMDAPSALPTS